MNPTAKTWGTENKHKILMIHGLLDNSESFSGLVPLLPKSYCYVAIDLPGHGKSSHFPRYAVPDFLDLVIAVRIVIGFLKDNPIILIGHSYGGHIATVYTQLYPSEVTRLVLIESSYSNFREIRTFKSYYRDYLQHVYNSLMKLSNKIPPTFMYEEGLQTFIEKRFHGGMTRKAAEKLYKRNITKLDEGTYQSKTDPLLMYTVCMFVNASRSYDILKKYPITCPTLCIVGLNSKLPILEREILTQLLNMNSRALIKFVEGGHHVQSDSPNIVAPLVHDFLNQKCNL
ncbi:hypothetical protein RI129_004050 [Pyrocoelia pectoralis]|uniref:AB hydrolase-1 domain-containing protein n=1 Tax=Pyrocoelia pectoralis TaxID=417401 RepID=A0AAN7VS29_9COLE